MLKTSSVTNTEGWIIAVYLQLKVYHETGAFSDEAILSLMDHLVWERLTEQQQTFLLYLSPFETVTIQQACILAGFETLPEYALSALQNPFIRYERNTVRYEMHSILSELLTIKRRERGEMFEHECFIRAGNYCRDNNRNAEAIAFYRRIKNYRAILSVDFSQLIFDEIGDINFSSIVLELVQNCPEEIKKEYPLSMLRIAWALKAAGFDEAFESLLDKLNLTLGQDDLLRAEWLLLSSYRFFQKITGDFT